MRKDIVIAVAALAVIVIGYLAWRGTDDGTPLDTNAPQVTAPQNAPTTKPPAAAPEKAQP